MTAYELIDIGQSQLALNVAHVSLWLAVLSGYLVIAYTVGAKLTRTQVVVFNLNYLIWSIFLGVASGNTLQQALTNTSRGWEMLDEASPVMPWTMAFFYLIGVMLIVSAVCFMWSVRHPKVE